MTFPNYPYVVAVWVLIAIIWWAFDEIRILAKRVFSKKKK